MNFSKAYIRFCHDSGSHKLFRISFKAAEDDRSNTPFFFCSFERDFCGVELRGTWFRGAYTQTTGTGPDQGARNSRYFAFLEGDAVIFDESQPEALMTIMLPKRCSYSLDFYYFIYGPSVGSLRVVGLKMLSLFAPSKVFSVTFYRDGG